MTVKTHSKPQNKVYINQIRNIRAEWKATQTFKVQ